MEKKEPSEICSSLGVTNARIAAITKSLEQKGYITRRRSAEDERVLIAALTPEGKSLQDAAAKIPQQIGGCIPMQPEDAFLLHKLLYKLLHSIEPHAERE